MAKDDPHFVIVGGGLGGALMAAYLGRAGYRTDVFEMRDDARQAEIGGGRSINLALSHRGICALERVGIADKVMQAAIPMRGRMIHGVDGSLGFQPYGKDESHAINSVSRNGLNAMLLEAADSYESVSLYFGEKCTGVDLDRPAVEVARRDGEDARTVAADVVVSADGAFSAVRQAMQKRERFDYSQSYLAHGYKELTIPSGPAGSFRMEKHALHIWPRRSFMMIALPNADGSYTCTLFAPMEGPNSFAAVRTAEDVRGFFARQFPDAVPLMPTLVEDYATNPVGSLVTIRCGPWHVEDTVVLLGDACHAVVPFYGQGMNAAFEDVLVLSEMMERHRPDLRGSFAAYYQSRKADVDTLADLAIENFVEMRDHTGSRMFLLKKKVEKALHKLLPRWYIPLYTMVTFTRMPYAAAVARAKYQNRVVKAVGALIALLVVVAIAAALA